MKLSLLLSLLALSLVQEGDCTHLETCDCHEIQELVHAEVQEAATELTEKINKLHDMISSVNTTLQTSTKKITNVIDGTELTGENERGDLQKSLAYAIDTLLKPIRVQLNYHLPPPPPNSKDHPAESCKALFDIDPDTPSGDYWISTSDSPVKVYCNMDTICANYPVGWVRVANIDMRNTSHQCPSGMSLVTRSSEPTRLCNITSNGCISKTFSVKGIEYSHVYGRIIGYQHSYSLAFYFQSRGIDGEYVYGVSLTHGQSPRNHIWTFAGAVDETSRDAVYKCPCTNTNVNPSVPSFVGTDYFCDTSLPNHFGRYSGAIYTDDPLWTERGVVLPTPAVHSIRAVLPHRGSSKTFPLPPLMILR